jgi:putative membrane protein
MKTIYVALLTLIAMCSPVMSQDKQSQEFIREAIEGNYFEVEMGKLAQQKGSSEEVKSFGATLVTDHGNANQKAIDVAKKVGVTPPTGPNEKQKADQEKLAKMSGRDFDKSFAEAMVMDHKKDIADYQKAERLPAPVGVYAKGELPTLQRHLRTAEDIEKRTR